MDSEEFGDSDALARNFNLGSAHFRPRRALLAAAGLVLPAGSAVADRATGGSCSALQVFEVFLCQDGL